MADGIPKKAKPSVIQGEPPTVRIVWGETIGGIKNLIVFQTSGRDRNRTDLIADVIDTVDGNGTQDDSGDHSGSQHNQGRIN